MNERAPQPDCRDAVLLLPWLANGSLTGPEAREVREHLIRCSPCRQQLRETRAFLAMVDALPAPGRTSVARPAPDGASAPTSSPVPPRSPWHRRREDLLRWAAAVVLVLGTVFLYRSLAPDAKAPSPETSVLISAADSRPKMGPSGPEAPQVVFQDGFETRDLGRWSFVGTSTGNLPPPFKPKT